MAPATRLSSSVESQDSRELCMMFYLVFGVKPEQMLDLDFIEIDDDLFYHYRVLWNNYQIFLNVKYTSLDCRIDSWNVKDSSGNSLSSHNPGVQEVRDYLVECGLQLSN
jgi:hypothetical protein